MSVLRGRIKASALWVFSVLCICIGASSVFAGLAPQPVTTFSPFNENPVVKYAEREDAERATVTCSSGATQEFESGCGFPADTTNGGCSGLFPAYTSIVCGQSYCGTAYFNGAQRDTDWYEITVGTATTVTWSVIAEYRVVAGLVAGTNGIPNCSLATGVSPFAIAESGQLATITICLQPGTWWFFTAPDFGQPSFPCGKKYQATLTCASGCSGGACCLPNNSCAIAQDVTDCVNANGRYQGDTTTCSTVNCTPPANDECVGAIALMCAQPVTADLRNATVSPSEPSPALCDDIRVASLWYRMVGDGNTYSLSTCDSNLFDPLAQHCTLTVYSSPTSSCPTNYVVEACSRDGCGPTGGLASLCFNTNVGRAYYIQISVRTAADRARFRLTATCPCPPEQTGVCCFPGPTCIELSSDSCANVGGSYLGNGTTCAVEGASCPDIDPPTNDFCDSPRAVTVPSTTVGYTRFATRDEFSSCGLPISGPGVWYRVVGNGRRITASTCSPTTNFDTRLHVYCQTCTTGNMTCVASNEDGPEACQVASEVTWCSASGAVYSILVSGYENQTGDFALTLSDDGVSCSNPAFCGSSCLVVCPPNGIDEKEITCDFEPAEITNGGCGMTTPMFGAIAAGQTVCGTSGTYTRSDGTPARDTDWFKFTIQQRSIVTWKVKAEFLVQALIVGADCSSSVPVHAIAFGNACQDVLATATLDPGEYAAFVSPQYFEGVACSASNWMGTLTVALSPDNGACCFLTCPKCRILPEDLCEAQGGVFFYGPGSTCQSSTCNPCPADLNGDLIVNNNELSILLSAFGRNGQGDMNCDGLTNFADLSILLANWGRDCRP